ncbi:MAG: SH3 domain-containing protein [Candidatus Omnitrophota bacterium]
MHSLKKIVICAGILFVFTPCICIAQDQDPGAQELAAVIWPKTGSVLFYGEITEDNINIRTDSTVSSEIICAVNSAEPVEVIRESYEWYKIRLPVRAPAFISKEMVEPIDGKTAKVKKNKVNIRLNPDRSSPILGQADKNEIINIVGEKAGWYKIEPTSGSSGWVHKKFVAKSDTVEKRKEPVLAQKTQEDLATDEGASADENVVIEGIIKPYGRVFRRMATHKLISIDKKVFLLKGNRSGLDSLNNHKVKITGKLIQTENRKYPVIEIQKIEAMY